MKTYDFSHLRGCDLSGFSAAVEARKPAQVEVPAPELAEGAHGEPGSRSAEAPAPPAPSQSAPVEPRDADARWAHWLERIGLSARPGREVEA